MFDRTYAKEPWIYLQFHLHLVFDKQLFLSLNLLVKTPSNIISTVLPAHEKMQSYSITKQFPKIFRIPNFPWCNKTTKLLDVRFENDYVMVKLVKLVEIICFSVWQILMIRATNVRITKNDHFITLVNTSKFRTEELIFHQVRLHFQWIIC